VPIAIVIGVTACGGNGSWQQSQTAISLLDVESSSANREACYLHLQPKDPAGPGGAMWQSISFYQELSINSSGLLSRAFQLQATRITQVAPYYDADQFPPVELMDKLQEATWLIDALCEKVLSGGAPNSDTTATTDVALLDTTTTTDAALSNGASACAYIAEKIFFDPWGWDVYNIKADAEIDFGKTIGGSSYGMTDYLVRSFNKYIKVYRNATDLTSDINIRRAFQSIIDLLTNYMESHDVIPYPDFEPEFDRNVSKAVSRTRDACNSATVSQVPTTIAFELSPTTTVRPTTTTTSITTTSTTIPQPVKNHGIRLGSYFLYGTDKLDTQSINVRVTADDIIIFQNFPSAISIDRNCEIGGPVLIRVLTEFSANGGATIIPSIIRTFPSPGHSCTIGGFGQFVFVENLWRDCSDQRVSSPQVCWVRGTVTLVTGEIMVTPWVKVDISTL